MTGARVPAVVRSLSKGILLVAAAWIAAAPPAAAISYCADAERYLDKAGSQSRIEVLYQIVAACPRHAAALNNLAVMLEEKGEHAEAEALYRRAIAADPDMAAPHAGLGDVLRARKDYGAAAAAYEAFLARLETAHLLGDAKELQVHAPLYRERLAEMRAAAAAAGQPVPSGDLVPAQQIARSLTTPPRRTRGLGLRHRTEPYIDLQIRFDFDSDRLRPEAARQIAEIAGALSEAILKERRILIEGHTDATGAAEYNQDLSERRAAAVRAALIARGVDPTMLTIAAYGEAQPIGDNANPVGQALNRRVTFVNIGAR